LAAPAEPAPHLIVTGERVALGPLREDLIPVYARWVTSPEVARGVGSTIIYTVEAEKRWYEEATKPDPGQALFTVYDRVDLVPIGTTGLTNIDHRHGTATFGIMLGRAARPRAGDGDHLAGARLGLHGARAAQRGSAGLCLQQARYPLLREGRLPPDRSPPGRGGLHGPPV
jgi:hypothetical protein